MRLLWKIGVSSGLASPFPFPLNPASSWSGKGKVFPLFIAGSVGKIPSLTAKAHELGKLDVQFTSNSQQLKGISHRTNPYHPMDPKHVIRPSAWEFCFMDPSKVGKPSPMWNKGWKVNFCQGKSTARGQIFGSSIRYDQKCLIWHQNISDHFGKCPGTNRSTSFQSDPFR